MKKKSLVISIILIILAMTLNTFCFADGETSLTENSTGSIKVSGVESGLTVTIYKLTKVNIRNNQPTDTPYEWDNSVQNWIDSSKYSSYSNPENFYKSFSTVVGSDSEGTNADLATFYSALASAIKSGNIVVSTSIEGTADSNGITTFTGLNMGTYLILVDNGYYIYRTTAVNLVPTVNKTSGEWELLTDAVEVELKRSEIGIEKTVTNANTTKDNYSTADTISFSIVSDVPNSVYKSSYNGVSFIPTYTVTDELSDGLVLDETSIVVKGDTTQLTSGTDYTITKYDSNGNVISNDTTKIAKFVISFTNISLYDYEKVQITYDCKLDKSDAIKMNGTGNVNTATLTYSNNTYDSTSTNTKTSSNTVYTYGIEVTKVDNAEMAKKLSGAEFTLSDSNGKLLYFVKTVDGKYYLANSTDNGATTNLVNNDSGMLYLYGLDEGTYTLAETKAPSGYNLSSKTVNITITDKDVDGLIEKDDGTETSSGIYTVTFGNSAGFQLPLTGGVGTVVFVACGIVFIGLGIVMLYVISRKRN